LLVNNQGLPVAVDLHAGNRHDLKAAASIIYAIPKYSRVTADRGYDSQGFRQKLRKIGIQPLIPKLQMASKKCTSAAVKKCTSSNYLKSS
jgi:transposase